jgi:hypothetical protein
MEMAAQMGIVGVPRGCTGIVVGSRVGRAFMHAYFDDSGCVNWHSGVVGTRSGCGLAFMLVSIADNNCISI